ncbi:MAG: hypothetical protein NVS9B10_31180 [Nevskia sp.]
MRIAILSDIHGNAHALARCLKDLAQRGGADIVVAAGDLCLDGPKPATVLERLRAASAQCLRGNTDRMIGAGDLAELDPEDARGVAWTRDRIGPRWTRWLGELPASLSFGGTDGLLVCHANPRSDDEHVWPDADDATLERLPAGLQFTDVDGKVHAVDEYRGKLLVINFWATWCGPCLHEIPALIKLQGDYGAKGFQLVGPAVDDPDEVRGQLKKLGFNYPVFVGESDAMLDLMTRLGNTSGALPFSVVVAPDGRILQRELGEFAPVELAGLIEETLAKKP